MDPQIRESTEPKPEIEAAFKQAWEAAQGLEREVKRMLAPLEMGLDPEGGSVEVMELAHAVRRRERAARKQRWKRKKRRQVAQAREEVREGDGQGGA